MCDTSDDHSRSFEVRAANGHALWGQRVTTPLYQYVSLSPRGDYVSMIDAVYTSSATVLFPAGTTDSRMQQHYQPQGWLDDSTFVANTAGPTPSLAIVSGVGGSLSIKPLNVDATDFEELL